MAEILGFDERTIRRDIASMSEDVRIMSVECPTNVRHMIVTEYGLKWLADKHNVVLEFDDSLEDETDKQGDIFVNHLLEQLRQKDLQLAEKDRQISQLIEQARNYQVLLRAEQERPLSAPKRSFIHRLFGRSSSDQ